MEREKKQKKTQQSKVAGRGPSRSSSSGSMWSCHRSVQCSHVTLLTPPRLSSSIGSHSRFVWFYSNNLTKLLHLRSALMLRLCGRLHVIFVCMNPAKEFKSCKVSGILHTALIVTCVWVKAVFDLNGDLNCRKVADMTGPNLVHWCWSWSSGPRVNTSVLCALSAKVILWYSNYGMWNTSGTGAPPCGTWDN